SGAGPAMANQRERRRWYQIPLSSARVPRSGIFSYRFQAGLRRYQRLRALRHLPVGRPVAPPPPGLLEPWPPNPPPTHSPPRASHSPLGASGVRGERGPAAGRAAPAGSPEGEANHGQRTAVGTVPQQADRSSGGHPLGRVREHVSSMDSEDDDLIPPKDLLLAGDKPPSPADHQQIACSRPDPLAKSLDSLVREKREERLADTLQAGLAQAHVDDDSPWESPEEDTQLPKEHREFLAHVTVKPTFLPTVHPGEPVFCTHSAPAPTLDTHGLKPQNTLEGFFLRNSPACQEAFGLFCLCVPTCPLPVPRWLFQVSQRRRRVGVPSSCGCHSGHSFFILADDDPPWCPTVQEISQAFTRLGADLSPLCRRRLLPPELCPVDQSLDPSCSPKQASPSAASTLALVTQLRDICKILALCVVAKPCHYADSARLALVTLLSFLGLDRALCCQPLPELQHLLHCLLEGIRDWPEQ
ncbi:F178B protein, partial [Pluvianellus socialis]|nr:F178B protein [Pluvianellus socialis]